MKAIADSVAKLARPLIGKRGFAQAEILLEWATIVGPDLARLSVPVKLSFPRKEGADRSSGILHLKVSSAAALEIQHMEPQILERVNGYCGYPAVARLMLKQGAMPRVPSPPQPPRRMSRTEETHLAECLGPVEHDALKQALSRLAQAVFDREKR